MDKRGDGYAKCRRRREKMKLKGAGVRKMEKIRSPEEE